MGTNPIISVDNLTKVYRNFDRRVGVVGAVKDLFDRRYREIRAVDDVSFTIAPGEIVGYIGANGAGKSTTIKMLVGILSPTSGSMLVNGRIPMKQRYEHAREIGVVFGQRTQLWWDLAVIEAYNLLQKIYRVPPEDFKRRLDVFVEVLDIGGQLYQPVRKLSLGQRMKCDLCASLLHNPPLLFLDEPTIGLDVAVKERIRRFIRAINREEGSTVILTTHDMTDIEELCPRLIIIDEGKILFDGQTTEIKQRFGQRRRVVLTFKQDYLPQYKELPLPPGDAPLRFSGFIPGNANGSNGNSLDEPGARQFMAALGQVMDDGAWLRVRRLNLRQFQLSFERNNYTARDVIGKLLERFDVDDLELHEPELGDIIRAIYDGKHTFSSTVKPA